MSVACCLKAADKQIAAFVAAFLSFVAQVLSALIIQDTGYFFGIITFSLCCHALLFHGIRKRKMSFMIPYLVCQIVCAAYVLGETFNYARGLSSDQKIAGCFYPDVQRSDMRGQPCSVYFWGSEDDFDNYNRTYGAGFNITCNQCHSQFKHYGILVVVTQAVVLVSFVLTWNIVLRFVLFLRQEKIRQRSVVAPTVSYFNAGGIPAADVIPENPPRPLNAPPVYSEKAQTLDPTVLAQTGEGTNGREERTDSLPPYEDTPVFVVTPASSANDSAYQPATASTEHPQTSPNNTNNTSRPVNVDDLL